MQSILDSKWLVFMKVAELGSLTRAADAFDVPQSLISRHARVTSGRVMLTVDAVERLFARLAMQAAGAVPQGDRLPDGPRFAATLVILRELMHHLRFGSVEISPGGLDQC